MYVNVVLVVFVITTNEYYFLVILCIRQFLHEYNALIHLCMFKCYKASCAHWCDIVWYRTTIQFTYTYLCGYFMTSQ